MLFRSVGVALAITGIVAAFSFMQDKARENADKANAEVDRAAEYRKQQEKKLLAEAGNDGAKQYALKRQFAQNEINDTQTKIKTLEKLQRSNYGLSEDQEKQLNDLRKQYSQQRVDYEVMAIERINALNAARVGLERKYNQLGMSERDKQRDDLKNAYEDEKKRLTDLGATKEDLAKNDAIYAGALSDLKIGRAHV